MQLSILDKSYGTVIASSSEPIFYAPKVWEFRLKWGKTQAMKLIASYQVKVFFDGNTQTLDAPVKIVECSGARQCYSCMNMKAQLQTFGKRSAPTRTSASASAKRSRPSMSPFSSDASQSPLNGETLLPLDLEEINPKDLIRDGYDELPNVDQLDEYLHGPNPTVVHVSSIRVLSTRVCTATGDGPKMVQHESGSEMFVAHGGSRIAAIAQSADESADESSESADESTDGSSGWSRRAEHGSTDGLDGIGGFTKTLRSMFPKNFIFAFLIASLSFACLSWFQN